MAFAGVFSEVLPAVMSGVPFQAAQTYKIHEICIWWAIAVLIVMIMVLVSHMWLVKWPHLAANPNILAVWAYYVCDFHMLRDFERLSMLGRRERDRWITRMGRMYRFGWITRVSGERRIGIDYADGERGYKLKALGTLGFDVGAKMRER